MWFFTYNRQVDYVGQNRVDNLIQGMLTGSAVVAWLVGLVMQQMRLTIYLSLVGLAATCLLCIPAWPVFCRNPIQWAVKPAVDDSVDDDALKAKALEQQGLLQKVWRFLF
ncbi:hypothetical protein CXG81DRAFT_15387 [Caulochytrium protostelioides]|uniref:Signal peptidase complex subunit 1 n=1 Tax=Caulochytrium protostelioides TaxID=1555241 RepID=A0A4V1IU00_9FUNG|nr:hypothetical protein CXG81DRAFT_15387 [Caulochytrium protostelioides]|eukprot:RKO98827.1 hypothetical protein CXG81DRAFT_15387 [Caulochytrium protostelioides]